MGNKKSLEAIIGGIILLVCTLFFSHFIKVNNLTTKGEVYKEILYAKFNNIEGIKIGSEVKIAGVRVGVVKDLKLDTNTFQVKAKLNVAENLNIPSDSVIAVTSSGLLGGKFLNIKPGIEDNFLINGASFSSTQSSLNLEDLIGKVVAAFSSK